MNKVSSIATPIFKTTNSNRVNLTDNDDESIVTNYSNPMEQMLPFDDEYGISLNKDTVESKDDKEQLCLVVHDPNK